MTKKIRKPSTYQQQSYQKPPHEQDYKKQKLNDDIPKTGVETHDNDQENSQDSVINVDKDDPPAATAAAVSTQLPAARSLAQSAFYPYVDPLHFFIDLRVSAGQIYDRKKEAYLQQALSSWNNNNPIIGKNRNSAFKVPISSQSEQSQNFNAINLISNQQAESSSRGGGYQKIYKSSRSEDDDDDTPSVNKSEDVQIFDLDKTERMN
jgi:hypothetical protein